MASKSDLLPSLAPTPAWACKRNKARSRGRNVFEVAVLYGLIVASIWTLDGTVKFALRALALFSLIGFTLAGGYTASEMGLTRPPLLPSLRIVFAGMAVALVIPLASMALGMNAAAAGVPLRSAWQYIIWAAAQGFILLSFICLRLEHVMRTDLAVIATAILFSLSHPPSPVLTGLTLAGGFVFCELFRRTRNIYAIGLAHGILGLIIAASSDRLMHHMRVGVGYVTFLAHKAGLAR